MSDAQRLTLDELGEYCRSLREMEGYTQKELAAKLCVDQSAISNVENMKPSASLKLANKIMVMLGSTTVDRSEIRVGVAPATDEDRKQVENAIEAVRTGDPKKKRENDVKKVPTINYQSD